MALPRLNPKSELSKVILPPEGDLDNVDSIDCPLPFGVYTNESLFDAAQIEAYKRGSVDQVAYTYRKLGGSVLDIELTECEIHAAYEESILEYSYLLNIHQGKNVLSNILAGTTGSFNEDGELTGDDPNEVQPGANVNLTYPRFDFAYARRVASGISEELGIGGNITVFSASFAIERGKQDYDLQTILRNSDEFGDDDSLPDFIRSIGTNKVQIKDVYYRTPRSMWQFYGYYSGSSIIGNRLSYGAYADSSYFHLMPIFDTKLRAITHENFLYNRGSHYSYELKNNKLRIFPVPSSYPNKMWIEFTMNNTDPWEQEPLLDGEAERNINLRGINNLNTLPFTNLPYENINSIGKQWIRRFALALSKETLGLIRSKLSSIPIPGAEVTLNGADLISQGKEEQDKLREEMKTILDELTYGKLAEGDATLLESTQNIQQKIPVYIYTG
jgi:hypothetical protein